MKNYFQRMQLSAAAFYGLTGESDAGGQSAPWEWGPNETKVFALCFRTWRRVRGTPRRDLGGSAVCPVGARSA